MNKNKPDEVRQREWILRRQDTGGLCILEHDILSTIFLVDPRQGTNFGRGLGRDWAQPVASVPVPPAHT